MNFAFSKMMGPFPNQANFVASLSKAQTKKVARFLPNLERH
ncbi:hypothetical protein RchiOBHm_Chr5g0001191 [Rosa chinensis]|uniref:Uncharacterized protein n=1 Tax=Rosa chinensis TaxID=74649 RepID=A0A2P6Q284_ROSCH|nr:hypothetical protein RchiOBHm_Chr5g0001191 [Rosa chinensis]